MICKDCALWDTKLGCIFRKEKKENSLVCDEFILEDKNSPLVELRQEVRKHRYGIACVSGEGDWNVPIPSFEKWVHSAPQNELDKCLESFKEELKRFE